MEGRLVFDQGLPTGGGQEGHGRFCRFIDEAGKTDTKEWFLRVSFDRWADSGDTPLWLQKWKPYLGPNALATLRNHKLRVVDHGGQFYVPIYLKTGVEYDRVLADVMGQVKSIAALVASV